MSCLCIRDVNGKLTGIHIDCPELSAHQVAGQLPERLGFCKRCKAPFSAVLIPLCEDCLAWVNTLPNDKASDALEEYADFLRPN